MFINGLLLYALQSVFCSSFAFLRSLSSRSRSSGTLLRRAARIRSRELASSTPSPTLSALLLLLLYISNDLHTFYVYCIPSFPFCQFSSSVHRLIQSPFMSSIHVGSLGSFIAPVNAEQVIIGTAIHLTRPAHALVPGISTQTIAQKSL